MDSSKLPWTVEMTGASTVHETVQEFPMDVEKADDLVDLTDVLRVETTDPEKVLDLVAWTEPWMVHLMVEMTAFGRVDGSVDGMEMMTWMVSVTATTTVCGKAHDSDDWTDP